MAFNVQILDTAPFRRITGQPAPETPVTANHLASVSGLVALKSSAALASAGSVLGAAIVLGSVGELEPVADE
jgi:hypothetical protein